ncbi:hypothetical protein [Pseudobacteroides cellulosolvens]|uniref:Immunity protein 49 n=1 Tax=Pseudobacteroides cellulosolvens ATCC 35603 = DSM 2933 TaxID=398512 RepID=A0A0L6JT47_9FIRM|nr:hypothetical protein [Pseudobacteroides cellulosolvens]KNY28860.1 hypothetical protein Bccel_4134 [Pseudobacteroides cellulosolvens ATCC 35603 = DSM 2933]
MVKGKKSYLEIFPEIYQEMIERVEKRIKKFKANGFPANVSFYLSGMVGDFRDLGIGEIILKEDFKKAKVYFYYAAKAQEAIYTMYDSKQNNISADFVSTVFYPKLFLALLSDQDKIIQSLAQLFGGREKEEIDDDSIDKCIGYSIKYILLNQDITEKAYIKELKELSNAKELSWDKSYALTLLGIVNKDSSLVNEGLNFVVECHKKLKSDIKETPEELLCIPALGLAKMALKKGIDVSLNDSAIPMGVLEYYDIKCPEVDFV